MKKLIFFLLVVLAFILPAPRATGAFAAQCGVIHNPDGTYSFERLHTDPTGRLVDATGCHVDLLGVNGVGAMAGDGGNIGNANSNNDPLPIHSVTRIAMNERWYVSNVNVPKQGMGYQAWIDTIIHVVEGRGSYVMLDMDTAFFEPPCGPGVSFCPSEGQGRIDYANPNSPYYHNPNQLEESQGIAVKALKLLAQKYASDPAVMFDVWNEPSGYIFVIPNTQQNRAAWMDGRISAVRQYDPLTPVVVFTAGTKENSTHTEPNLIFDWHVYPQWSGKSPVTGETCSTGGPNWTNVDAQMAAMRQAGHAVLIGEWGGCYDVPSYNSQILALAEKYNANMTYFQYGNLVKNGQINGNGQLEQQDYQSLLAQG